MPSIRFIKEHCTPIRVAKFKTPATSGKVVWRQEHSLIAGRAADCRATLEGGLAGSIEAKHNLT